MNIAIVDYCKGNLRNVQKGLQMVAPADTRVFITMDPVDVDACDAVVLPGVGAFADASATMGRLGLMDAVRAAIDAGKPFLGICLGMHLLLEAGEEGQTEQGLPQGMGVIAGTCRKMPSVFDDAEPVKIPHVGWNTVDFASGMHANDQASRLFEGIPDHAHFYFTHSYACVPHDPADIVATTHHGKPFASAVARGNALGVQFHPEKSSDIGIRVLGNFVNKVCRA